MAYFYDTLVAEYIKNPGVRGLNLDKIAKNQFNYEMMDYKTVVNKNKNSLQNIETETISMYSAEKAMLIYKLFDSQKQSENQGEEKKVGNTVKTKQEKKGIMYDIDFPLIMVLKKMEMNGVCVQRGRLKEIGTVLENEILILKKRIIDGVGEEFNINSPKQVGEILFGKMNLPTGKRTKTGWSVSAEVLGELAKEYNIAQEIIDYRHYSKLLSTYIVGLLELLDTVSGVEEYECIHTNYNQTVTATGRLSSTKPNLQNIPSGGGIAGEIRSAFVSRFEKGTIMAVDYSQVEVRLLALMSGDENLIAAFREGEDIHEKTAKFLGGAERKIAKAVNFGVIYGISGFGLAKMIDITVADGNKYIKKFYENYPKVQQYFDRVIQECEETGYVETMHGRKRYIKGINDRNKMIKSAAEREAINMPIQGTSSDILKIAMIQVDEFIAKEQLKTKLIMHVHDELVFDVYPGEEKTIEGEVVKIMEGVIGVSDVELKVDCSFGETWKDTK